MRFNMIPNGETSGNRSENVSHDILEDPPAFAFKRKESGKKKAKAKHALSHFLKL